MIYPDFYNSIPKSLQYIRKSLTHGFLNRQSAFRTMNLCYIYDNKPYCRTVVLRDCHDDLLYLQCHTDYRSPKIQALRENNQIAAHFYDSHSKIQITLNGTANIHYKDDIAKKAWDNTQVLSRRCYLSQLPPSYITTEADTGFDVKFINNTQNYADTEIGYDNFSVIRIMLQKIDWLYLHAHGNRRIIFTKNTTEFKGQWCIP